MTTTDVLLGAAVVLLVARQVRAACLEHLHAERPATGRELARLAAGAASASGTVLGAAGAVLAREASSATSAVSRAGRAGRGAGARRLASLAVRCGFLVWLYDITDGAAFSPFGFAQDLVRGTVWQPVLVALGLTEVVGRAGAVVVRAVTRADRAPTGPAVPVRMDQEIGWRAGREPATGAVCNGRATTGLHGDDLDEVLDADQVGRVPGVEARTVGMSGGRDHQVHDARPRAATRGHDGRGELAGVTAWPQRVPVRWKPLAPVRPTGP